MSDRLAEIRARLNAATPWPWRVVNVGAWLLPKWTVFRDSSNQWEKNDNLIAELDYSDADFIAHAPADIAWLLSTLEDASERIAILRAEIADLEARP